MDSERCKIKLDSPQNIYYSGQTIKGEISIILTKKTKIRGINFKVHGYGKCNWFELLRRESDTILYPKRNPRSGPVAYSSSATYIDYDLYLIGSKSARPIELEPGTHTYPFTYDLQRNLPSSFSGSYGCIKYRLKFSVDKAWNFDDKYTIPITIVRSNPLSLVGEPVLRQVTRNIGMLGGGPVSLVGVLPQQNAVRGGKAILRVTVDNKSNIHVEKLKFSIKQYVKYYSNQPILIEKDEVIKLYKKEAGGIQKKSERTFEHELFVPPCPPTETVTGWQSSLIAISYNIHVDVVLPGLYKNISLVLPLEVRSHEEIIEELGQPRSLNSSTASYGVCPVMAFYPLPNLDTGMGSGLGYARDTCSLSSFESNISEGSPPSTVPITFPMADTGSGPSSLRRDASNRSSIVSTYSIQASSYPASATTTPVGHRYADEPPPSYDELYGDSPESPKSVPSAPPLYKMQK